tara:strand:- start:842 stop:1069 length:228 start_codon:yes stop_codon:yes gene_type:complete
MITAILIILTFAVNFILLVLIKQQQEISHSIHYKIQDDMWDEVTEIKRTVKAIDKKIEDSTVYKTELRFVDNKKD